MTGLGPPQIEGGRERHGSRGVAPLGGAVDGHQEVVALGGELFEQWWVGGSVQQLHRRACAQFAVFEVGEHRPIEVARLHQSRVGELTDGFSQSIAHGAADP